jgi:transposase
VEALSIYRNKDFVEKSFLNLKNRLDFNRTHVYSTTNLEGLVFIKFISLILSSYINKQMIINNLYDKYTLKQVVNELDLISLYTYTNNKSHYSEITSKQLELYKLMNVAPIINL